MYVTVRKALSSPKDTCKCMFSIMYSLQIGEEHFTATSYLAYTNYRVTYTAQHSA